MYIVNNNLKMVDFEELWIGDMVFVKSFHKNGTWEGFNKTGRAKIKIDGKIYSLGLSDLSDALEIIEEKEIEIEFDEKSRTSWVENQEIIDLHIENLNPELKNTAPQLILIHQLKKCRRFIESAIESNNKQFLIIHGVGAGVLKSEVLHLLKDFDEVQFTFPKHNGGATEVWLKY